MAVRTTWDTELPKTNNWNDWLPTSCPDISDLDLWARFGQEWNQEVRSMKVDTTRTNLMMGWNDKVRSNTTKGTIDGVHGGAPFQRLDKIPTRNTKTYVATAKPSLFNLFPSTIVPLPDYIPGNRATVLRRFGDPTVTGSDTQSFFLAPTGATGGRYYELSAFGPCLWPFSLIAPWRADNVEVWDMSIDWRNQRKGITGAKVPFLPMLATYEEYETSIDHALHFVANAYNKGEKVGIAKGTDGETVGHPLRAGERMRMTEEAYNRLLASSINKHSRAVVEALYKYGMILTDKTGTTVPHAIRHPMDVRVQVDLDIELKDFEVVVQD